MLKSFAESTEARMNSADVQTTTISKNITKLTAFLKFGRNEVTVIGKRAKKTESDKRNGRGFRKAQIITIENQIEATKEKIIEKQEELAAGEDLFYTGEIGKCLKFFDSFPRGGVDLSNPKFSNMALEIINEHKQEIIDLKNEIPELKVSKRKAEMDLENRQSGKSGNPKIQVH